MIKCGLCQAFAKLTLPGTGAFGIAEFCPWCDTAPGPVVIRPPAPGMRVPELRAGPPNSENAKPGGWITVITPKHT